MPEPAIVKAMKNRVVDDFENEISDLSSVGESVHGTSIDWSNSLFKKE